MDFRLYRVILPVTDIEEAVNFYSRLFEIPGEPVSSGRHYFKCGDAILACLDPKSDGRTEDLQPNPEHIYFAIDDPEATLRHCQTLPFEQLDKEIKTRPWSEQSFYARDPFGNKLCFVKKGTEFLGGGFIP